MKILKKMLLSTLCACCAMLAGIAGVGLVKETKTASAAVATEYTTVDVPMMMKLENVYEGNGNFNIYVTLPQYDFTGTVDNVQFAGVDFATVFDGFGFFDSVKIGEKTLRELGCTQFFNNQMAFGVGEPKNIVKLYLHADPAVWMEAFNNGEVVFGDNQTPVTIGKGTVIPGYNYLSGGENAVVYRADMTYVTNRVTQLTYSYYTAGQTEIDSVKYVQGHDGNCGYLGVSFVGDDYATDGTQEAFLPEYKHAYEGILLPDAFNKKILVNGEAGKVECYSLLNLGEAGKGYFSFVIRVHEDDVETVTIPKGTYFPSYVMKTLKELNGHFVYMGYQTTEDVVFYKNANGDFATSAQYAENYKSALNAIRAEKTAEEYFEGDLTAMDEAIAAAVAALEQATTTEEMDLAFNTAKGLIDGVETKSAVIDNAKADLNTYKAGEFREAEEAQRAAMVEAGCAAIDNAASKAEVEAAVVSVKADVDTLKTAAQYADEELADEKAAANAEINGYLADVAYLAEQKAERDAAVETGLAAVVSAKTSAEIAQAVTDAKAAMEALATKATIVDGAKAVVEAYNADKVYRTEQAEARAAAITAAKEALDNATCQADVDNAVNTAKATIDALKTDIELTEEEKAAADALFGEDKAAALEKINELKAGVLFDEYSVENQAVINELYRLAKEAVANALTKEAINAAADKFETDLAAVAKIEVEEPGLDSTDSADSGSDTASASSMMGCQSSATLLGTVAVMTLGGVALTLKKKEN